MKSFIKDPHDIDGPQFTVYFLPNGSAEVLDCEGQTICISSRGVAVWLAMTLNAEDKQPCGLREPRMGESDKIADEMEMCGIPVPPDGFS